MELDRTVTRPLADQMFDRLREAIASGRYRPGDILPSMNALAAGSGVSVNVPRRALARLAKAGLVTPRRGVGSCVTNRRTDANSRGRILCCGPFGSASAYYDRLALALRQRLLRNGYLLELASTATGRANRDALARTLRHDWDLVLFWDNAHVRRLIADTPSRFVILGDSPVRSNDPNFLGIVSIKNGRGLPAFIRACIAKGAANVVQFRFDNDQHDATAAFEIAEIRVRTITLPQPKDTESCMRAGLTAVSRFLKRARPLPDILYFADDYLAQGGLLALSQSDLRFPEDIGIVTLANKGIGPVWAKPLTRLEMNPAAHGQVLAEAVLTYFREGKFPSPLTLGSDWVKGTTL